MPVNYARVRAAKAENLVIVANSRYLSGRYGDGFDKRGHPVRGDLGVVQYEVSRHSSLRSVLAMGREGRRRLRPQVLLVSCNGNGNRVLGKFRGRRAVHHRVRVLDADPVGSVMVLHDIHHGIVGSTMGPIALPFEHDGHGRNRLCAGLNDTLHRVLVSKLTHVAAAILHDVDLVAVMNRLHRRKRNTDFCPKPGNENLLASAFFDRGDKAFVVPRVHGRTLDGFLPREYGSQLRPHIPAEGFRLDRGQYHRYIKYSCGLADRNGVVDDSLAVEIACSKQHLALMVDQRQDAIVRSQESLLAQFWTIAV